MPDEQPTYQGQSQAIHVDTGGTPAPVPEPVGPPTDEADYVGRSQAIRSHADSPPQWFDDTILGPLAPIPVYWGRSQAIHVYGVPTVLQPPVPIPSCNCCAEAGGGGSPVGSGDSSGARGDCGHPHNGSLCVVDPVDVGTIATSGKLYTPAVSTILSNPGDQALFPPLPPTIGINPGVALIATGRGSEKTISIVVPAGVAAIHMKIVIQVNLQQFFGGGHPRVYTDIPFNWELRRADWTINDQSIPSSFQPTYDNFQLDPSGTVLMSGTWTAPNSLSTDVGPFPFQYDIDVYEADLAPDIYGRIQLQLRITDLNVNAAYAFNNWAYGDSFNPGTDTKDESLYSHSQVQGAFTIGDYKAHCAGTCYTDTFGRVGVGPGTSDAGIAWTEIGPGGTPGPSAGVSYATDGTGVILTAFDTSIADGCIDLLLPTSQFECRLVLSNYTTNDQLGFIDFDSPGSFSGHYLQLAPDFPPAGFWLVDGSNQINMPFTWAGPPVNIAAHFDNTGSKAKIWYVGDPEPDWQLELAADSRSGIVPAISLEGDGARNDGTTWKVSQLQVIDLSAVTVAGCPFEPWAGTTIYGTNGTVHSGPFGPIDFGNGWIQPGTDDSYYELGVASSTLYLKAPAPTYSVNALPRKIVPRFSDGVFGSVHEPAFDALLVPELKFSIPFRMSPDPGGPDPGFNENCFVQFLVQYTDGFDSSSAHSWSLRFGCGADWDPFVTGATVSSVDIVDTAGTHHQTDWTGNIADGGWHTMVIVVNSGGMSLNVDGHIATAPGFDPSAMAPVNGFAKFTLWAQLNYLDQAQNKLIEMAVGVIDLPGPWCNTVTAPQPLCPDEGCAECADPGNPDFQLPDFTPGFMPHFRKQIGDPTTSLDSFICTLESAAMVLDWHTRGAVSVWGGELIPYCGKTEAQIRGTGSNLGNARRAWLHWNQNLSVRSGQTFDDMLACLAEGRAVILQGDYGVFNLAERCQDSFEGNHAISVYPYQVGDRILVGDPLCSDFRGIRVSTLRAYAEALTGGSGILFAVSRPWTP